MRSNRFLIALAASLILMSATPSMAEFEGSKAEQVLASGFDAVLVRPIAAARVVVGAMFFLPATFISAPSGREGFDGAYDVFLAEPIEFAFRRELGEF